MGCLSDKSNLSNNLSPTDNCENYIEPDEFIFDLAFYKLGWKAKPNICIYQRIDEETLDKKDIANLKDIIKSSQIEEMKLVRQLHEMKNVLFYIYCREGVIITGNMSKINYILQYDIEELIKICIVDISSIIMTGSEYNSIHEIKNQSRFFFDLNQKEIDLTFRNDLINEGKNEDLSDTELDLDDEYLEELEKNKFEQHIYISEYEKEEKEEFEYEFNEKENEREISKLSIDKIINKKIDKKKEIEYIETNANENNLNESKNSKKINEVINENDNSNNNDDEVIIENLKGYEVRGNCLILSMHEMTSEIKKELKNFFFVSTSKDDSPYLYKQFYNLEEDKDKDIKKPKNKNLLKEDDKEKEKKNENGNENLKDENKEKDEEDNNYNDYIQIYKKHAIPYEKRTLFNKINKIIFKDCNFNKDSLCNLKDFFVMLSYYRNLTKICIYDNNISKEFNGWKFFRQLLRENFNIRWVSFKGANLNDELFEGIILGMTLKRIRYLNLSRNKITNKGLYFLNKFLMKNQTLLILDLSHNQYVTNEGIKLITNALKMHPNINKVDLSYMRIKGSGHYISNFIRDNKCLRSLFLKNCQFEKQDVEYFPTVFSQKDCQMEHLDLSLNSNIGEDGLKEIGKLITNNKSLISIGLDGINLSMNNYMPVFQGILKNKTIKSYSLNLNPGLPLKGILNFFLKNPYVKEISIIPWDYNKDKTKKFTDSQLQLFERFHKKAPDVVINGIYFD